MTRIRTDQFGDTWSVHTGPEARRIRREIECEFEQALARYDADPSPANRAACDALSNTQAEIGRRMTQLEAAE
jgi:hypothetical protein